MQADVTHAHCFLEFLNMQRKHVDTVANGHLMSKLQHFNHFQKHCLMLLTWSKHCDFVAAGLLLLHPSA